MGSELMRRMLEGLESEPVLALLTVIEGSDLGQQLVVWPAGQTLGDLGSPRLNQRASLYAQHMFSDPRTRRKLFDVQGRSVEVLLQFYEAATPN